MALQFVIDRVCNFVPLPFLSGLQKMAVAAYFPFDNRRLKGGGTATWAWAMQQWDRLAAAGGSVRVIVADQSYNASSLSSSDISDIRSKFQACRVAGQLVFGYVHCRKGKIPLDGLDQGGGFYIDAGGTWPDVRHQIDAWKQMYRNAIDGIYVDEGPDDCDPAIPYNYRDYVTHIRKYGYQVFLQTLQYPDNLHTAPGWLQSLGANYLNLIELDVNTYKNRYWALDYCAPNKPGIGVPPWWNAGCSTAYRHVHIIYNCPDATIMKDVVQLAISRSAWTVWITDAATAVYAELPQYWNDAVAYFSPPIFLSFLMFPRLLWRRIMITIGEWSENKVVR